MKSEIGTGLPTKDCGGTTRRMTSDNDSTIDFSTFYKNEEQPPVIPHFSYNLPLPF